MEKAVQRVVNKIVVDLEAEKNNSHLYRELKKQIEETKGTSQTSIMITDSAWMSADQVHHWFPDLEVSWKNNNIHIRW